MIRDKIVFSTEDPALKEREPKLDLQKAVDMSRSSELAYKEFVTMKGAEKSSDPVKSRCTQHESSKQWPNSKRW